jgi:hypothetical protein
MSDITLDIVGILDSHNTSLEYLADAIKGLVEIVKIQQNQIEKLKGSVTKLEINDSFHHGRFN